MLRSRRKIAISLIVTLCVAVQVAVVLPHHHHDSGASACINFLHCMAMPHEHTECTGHEHDCSSQERHDLVDLADNHGHSHHSTGDECEFNRVELVLPTRNESSDISTTTLALDTPLFTLLDITSDSNLHNNRSQSIVTLPDIDIASSSLYVLCVVATAPTRGPSFTA